MKIEVVSDFDHSDLNQIWCSLLKRYHIDNFFLTYRCMSTWWKHFGGNGKQLKLLIAKKRNDIVALAPFWSETIYIAKIFPLNIWKWVGSQYISPDHLEFIYDPRDAEDTAKSFADFLEHSLNQWDIVQLESLPKDSLFLKALIDVTKKEKRGKIFIQNVHRGEICPYIVLPDSYDEFSAKLSNNFRYKLRRAYKEWNRQGYQFRYREQPHELAEAFESFVILHRKRWQLDGKQGNFANPKLLAFHQELLQQNDGIWKPMFFEIIGKEGIVASLYAFVSTSKFFYYQMGYDPRFRNNRFIPGKVLIDWSIRYAISKQIHEFDLLRGDEPFKYDWRPWVRVRHEPFYYVFNHSFGSQMYARWKILRHELARLIRHKSDSQQTLVSNFNPQLTYRLK